MCYLDINNQFTILLLSSSRSLVNFTCMLHLPVAAFTCVLYLPVAPFTCMLLKWQELGHCQREAVFWSLKVTPVGITAPEPDDRLSES
ncbi:hypothetical protein EB796_016507 [Bugula neritina]|uniref:Uncharacterized protein n=1 Tax=Bugula neritina TaxID=10212 RepID=A0A7J7JI61_BUGNE|nr:hypothetical protein EB796_016507 [Bugula neritina]